MIAMRRSTVIPTRQWQRASNKITTSRYSRSIAIISTTTTTTTTTSRRKAHVKSTSTIQNVHLSTSTATARALHENLVVGQHQHQHQHQYQYQQLQGRSFSSFSHKIWDIIRSGSLNPSNPIADDLYKNIIPENESSPFLENNGGATSESKSESDFDSGDRSPRYLSLLFDYTKYHPHHFKEAAVELQSIYDKELTQLEDEIANDNADDYLTTINIIQSLDRISRPLITLQNIIVLLSTVKYNNGNGIGDYESSSYQALADASSSIQLRHETSTVIYQALKQLQNEIDARGGGACDKKLRKCTEYLLQRHRINGTPMLLNDDGNNVNNEKVQGDDDTSGTKNINRNNNDGMNHNSKEMNEQLKEVQARLSKIESKFLLLSSYTMEQHGKVTPTQKLLPYLYEIIALKQHYSVLLGYDSYLHYSLDYHSSSLKNVDQIKNLHDNFVVAVQKFSSREFQDKYFNVMSDAYLTDENTLGNHENARDIERNRTTSSFPLKDYFEFNNVLKELFSLCSVLFSIEIIEEKDTSQGCLGWDKDVRLFHVYEKENSGDREVMGEKEKVKIGSFYLDPFRRLNKGLGEFMAPIVHKSVLPRGNNQTVNIIPIAAISLDIRPPMWNDAPVKLEFDDVIHLFHEFGHLLQFFLADVDAGSFSGALTIEEDASEVVSQFMEYWLFEAPFLSNLTKHHETGEPLPSDIIQKIHNRNQLIKCNELLHRLFLGALEVEVNATFDPRGDKSIISLQRELAELYCPNHVPPKGNIDPLIQVFQSNALGKNSMQYRYLYSEIMSADAFSIFQNSMMKASNSEKEIQDLGAKFRRCFLEPGGTVSTKDNFNDFCGRNASKESLLKFYGLK